MQFTVNPAAFDEAATVAARAASNRGTLPVLSHLLIRAEGGRLHLTGSDLALGVTTSIEAEVEAPGAACLPAKTLLAIVRLDAPELTVAWNDGNKQAHLTWRGGRYDLAGYLGDEYPEQPQPTGEPILILTTADWRNVLARTAFCASRDDTGQPLIGVHLLVRPAGETAALSATASDTVRVAHWRQSGLPLVGAGDLVLPMAGARALQALLPDKGQASLYDAGGAWVVACETLTVSVRKVEGQYPDLVRLLPTEYTGARLRVRRQDLFNALERLTAMNETSPDVGWVVTARDLLLKIRGQSGTAEELVEADVEHVKGDAFTAGFNARYVIEGLRAMTGEHTFIGFTSEKEPARFRDSGADGYQYVVLPVINY